MSLRADSLVVDCQNPAAIGRWWAELLGWTFVLNDDGEAEVSPPEGVTATPLLFGSNPDVKSVKNRLHLDLRPDDQAAEVARAERLGARPIDIGQGDQTWVVLADPEGNEFCILSAG